MLLIFYIIYTHTTLQK